MGHKPRVHFPPLCTVQALERSSFRGAEHLPPFSFCTFILFVSCGSPCLGMGHQRFEDRPSVLPALVLLPCSLVALVGGSVCASPHFLTCLWLLFQNSAHDQGPPSLVGNP